MALCINQSGTWRDITTQCVNQSGTWRKVATGCINDSGTWREFGFGPALGSAYEGGYFICAAAGVRWIVAPSSTEVSRNWYSRNNAVTTAQASAACGDWFVPTCGQLRDPGFTCRTYWDSYSTVIYWSSTAGSSGYAAVVLFNSGLTTFRNSSRTYRVRAFRCVSY